MAVNWPGTLPTWQNIEVQGYRERDMYNVVTSEPDAGPYLTRKRFSAMPRRVSLTMLLTQTQLSTLKAFYKQYQAVRFTWNNVIGEVRYYNFAAPIEYAAHSGLYFRASLELWEFLTETGGS